jgi:hypothetical protein
MYIKCSMELEGKGDIIKYIAVLKRYMTRAPCGGKPPRCIADKKAIMSVLRADLPRPPTQGIFKVFIIN